VLQAEIASIAKEAQKIARVFPACYQQNFSDASIDQSGSRPLVCRTPEAGAYS
jgi:hypothetical protein